jgi:hypothetical protein
MRGMEVHLNGNKLCTAGIGRDGVLNTTLNVVSREGEYDMEMRIGGLENNEFLNWSTLGLRLGDEITVRIIETDSIDPPAERKPNVAKP